MNNPNDKLSLFIDAVGTLADLAGLYFKNLLRNGFTREEATVLVSSLMEKFVRQ